MDSRPSTLMEPDGLLLQEASLVVVVAAIRLRASSSTPPTDQVNPLPGSVLGELFAIFLIIFKISLHGK